MHRHGYKQRKLGRERDERRLLIKTLANDLIIHQKLQTTTAKAKTVIPYVEKLITKAKKGDLHNRRLVIAKLSTPQSAHKLFDQIVPQLTKRSSGHLSYRVLDKPRRGDGAILAEVVFVDKLLDQPLEKEADSKETVAQKQKPKKITQKKESRKEGLRAKQ